MAQLPFDIPKSLASYVDHFDEDPLKTIARLKIHLKKRGPDAVGHFLIAWFYHLKDMNSKAIDHALKAKIYAPGSIFLGNLHYYLAHPNTFDAWKPHTLSPAETRTTGKVHRPGPVLDLDILIEKLSEVESNRIRVLPELSDNTSPAIAEEDDDVDDIASETLATIHETQGKTEAAIQTYKRLKKLNREKKDFYKQQITRLKNLRGDQPNEEHGEDFNEE